MLMFIENQNHLIFNNKTRFMLGGSTVSSCFIKIAAPVIAKSLANIYNASIHSGIFPKDSKIDKAALIYKSGSKK